MHWLTVWLSQEHRPFNPYHIACIKRLMTLTCRWWSLLTMCIQHTGWRQLTERVADATKQNWPALKKALSTDLRGNSELVFLTSDDKWQWQVRRTDGMSLMNYKDGLLHRMTKYHPNSRLVQGEWERTAVWRLGAWLRNLVLEAHILLSCKNAGDHTLDHAFQVSVNFENTLQTITQRGTNSTMPNLAATLNISQRAAMTVGVPQFSVLTPLQKKKKQTNVCWR